MTGPRGSPGWPGRRRASDAMAEQITADGITVALTHQDKVVFDFDPPDGARFADVRQAALWARDLLDGELGLTSFARTSGGRGLHVHVPLNRRADFDAVRDFAHRAAEVLARRHPDAITTEQRKDKRGDRIYADVMRN